MVENQKEDLQTAIEDFIKGLPENPRETAELLNMRKIEKNLVKV